MACGRWQGKLPLLIFQNVGPLVMCLSVVLIIILCLVFPLFPYLTTLSLHPMPTTATTSNSGHVGSWGYFHLRVHRASGIGFRASNQTVGSQPMCLMTFD